MIIKHRTVYCILCALCACIGITMFFPWVTYSVDSIVGFSVNDIEQLSGFVIALNSIMGYLMLGCFGAIVLSWFVRAIQKFVWVIGSLVALISWSIIVSKVKEVAQVGADSFVSNIAWAECELTVWAYIALVGISLMTIISIFSIFVLRDTENHVAESSNNKYKETVADNLCEQVYELGCLLWAKEAPIMITDGRLLKNNQTGRIYATVMLRNIAQVPIVGVKIYLYLWDMLGEAVGEPIAVQYPDLYVQTGVEFGGDITIELPSNYARSFSLRLTNVVFAGNNVESFDISTWQTITGLQQQPLENWLGDEQLLKQFRILHGKDSKYWPVEGNGLWRCTCGKLNEQKASDCLACGRNKTYLFGTDMETLRGAAEERLVREEKVLRLRRSWVLIAAIIVSVVLLGLLIAPSIGYDHAQNLVAEGEIAKAAIAYGKLGNYRDAREKSRELWDEIACRKTIDFASGTVLGLRENGTVMAIGEDVCGECEVSDWADIIDVEMGGNFSVGLKEDGTVVVAGYDYYLSDIYKWKDVVAIEASPDDVLGLKTDGTVAVAGFSEDILREVSKWKNIVEIYSFDREFVGLKEDGTLVSSSWTREVAGLEDVVAVSLGEYTTVVLQSGGTVDTYGVEDYISISNMEDIVAVSAGPFHFLGLKEDGTVVAQVTYGDDERDCCDVSGWRNVVEVHAGSECSVGLTSNGSVLVAGPEDEIFFEMTDWTDIVCIPMLNDEYAIGIKADGTVVSVGFDDDISDDLSAWAKIQTP